MKRWPSTSTPAGVGRASKAPKPGGVAHTPRWGFAEGQRKTQRLSRTPPCQVDTLFLSPINDTASRRDPRLLHNMLFFWEKKKTQPVALFWARGDCPSVVTTRAMVLLCLHHFTPCACCGCWACTASPPWWAPLHCGCPAGTHGCALLPRMASGQRANPRWCVACVVVVRSRGAFVVVLGRM